VTPETLGISALHETVIAASPPDVRNRFQAQEIDPELDSIAPASPLDVRRGSAPPSISTLLNWAMPPVRA